MWPPLPLLQLVFLALPQTLLGALLVDLARETITMAPLVVRGKVMVGNSGGEFGVRG